MSGRQMSILIGLVVLLAIVSNSLYVVNERERAVLLKFGEVVSTDIQPGLHFKIPVVNDVRRFESRLPQTPTQEPFTVDGEIIDKPSGR